MIINTIATEFLHMYRTRKICYSVKTKTGVDKPPASALNCMELALMECMVKVQDHGIHHVTKHDNLDNIKPAIKHHITAEDFEPKYPTQPLFGNPSEFLD